MTPKQNQCVVISGESGSGKTESTNFLLHHLTSLSQKGSAASGLEQILLCAGPVLEAFGNAVTGQNFNSSRFGKFIQVNYRENGMVSGANVSIYLLEKSRIISQAIEERNYHVFYYLLQGASEKEKGDLFLLQPQAYHYLNQNEFYESGSDDAHEFHRLRQSMELVGFSKESHKKIFSILSAVLLLGNVQYVKRSGYHSDETAYIQNEEIVSIVSRLLEVREENLLQALTVRRTVMKNETVVARYKVFEAINTRDAMAKCLYNALFLWIVLRINQALLRRDMSAIAKGFYIGILDIFGFEDVGAQWNSFEQFCINFANERLQAYFNQHIFQFEQEEYLAQGICWSNIDYTDNTQCLQLIQSKPYGLFCLIDEECSIAKGTDESLLAKLNQFHKNNEFYETPHKKEPAFIIAHYAGKVKYQITGFREKNKDLMRQDVVMTLKNSKSAFVRELVCSDPVAIFRWAVVRASFRAMFAFRQAGHQLRKSRSTEHLTVPEVANLPRRGSESHLNALLRGEFKTETLPRKKAPKQKRSPRGLDGLKALKALAATKKPTAGRKIVHTVGAQFQSSLGRLMETLAHAQPCFIRCIKSNNSKIPCFFDEDIILKQLRYTGMLETVRIRRAGYSVRLAYEEFIAQYRIILPNGRCSCNDDVTKFFLDHPFIDFHRVQFGHSKVFMREAEKLLLDDQLHRTIMSHVVRLQGWFKTALTRRRFLHTKAAIVKIQSVVRGWLVRSKIQRQAVAALVIQTAWRRHVQRKRYKQLKFLLVEFQSVCRGFLLRHQYDYMDDFEIESYRKAHGLVKNDSFVKAEPLKFYDITPEVDKEQSVKIGSPGQQSDEGILTKDSSQDDALTQSVSQLRPRFQCDTDEESGISEDSEDSDNLTSADATFILEDTKLKLVGKSILMDRNPLRRPSLAPTASAKQLNTKIRRSASSDQLSTRETSFSSGNLPPNQEQIYRELPQKSTASPPSSAAKKRSGFVKAKGKLKAFLSRKSDSLQSDSEAEDRENLISAARKPKAFSLMPTSDHYSAATQLHSHTLKSSRMHRTEPCALCGKNISGILVQGYKCQTCRLCFHKECSQFSCKFPCRPTSGPASPDHHTKTFKPWVAFAHRASTAVPATGGTLPAGVLTSPEGGFLGSWSLTRTQQQVDPVDQVIGSLDDLRQFSVFIFKKQTELAQKKAKQRDTIVDAIFKKSLREFHTELISHEATLKEELINLKYKDLISCFEGSLKKVCVKEQITFPVTLGLNAFRGFLNEFCQQEIKRRAKTKSKAKSFRKKRRRSEVTITHIGHRFKADIVHVPTYCEVCNQFMWHAEKILICIGCRISCHKKCHSKLTHKCTSTGGGLVAGRVFGGDLNSQVGEEQPIPIVMEKLLLTLELHGLFVEGIYRKSGSAAQIKHLRRLIETTQDFDSLSFDDSPIHCLTSLVKSFCRELPEPLMTFELYENFLNVSETEDYKERLRCLSVMVELLPKANKALLDRVMYHLARVAHQSEVNKMNASNLAVIFGPCLLRRSHTVHAQEQLEDVNRQAICIQSLIEEKVRQYHSTMEEIVELEEATEKLNENLKKIDDHVRRTSGDYSEAGDAVGKEIEQARQLFVEQLDFLDKEKDKLMDELPPLAPVASSEDDCITSSDELETPSMGRRALTKQVTIEQEEYALDFGIPPFFSALKHPTKNRAPRPIGQRRPGKFDFLGKMS